MKKYSTIIHCVIPLSYSRRRYGNFEDFLARLDKVEGGVCKFSESYKNMGCRVGADNTFVCTQWIPGAQVLQLLIVSKISCKM